MADKHPYFHSPGNFARLIVHLRRTFPNNVSAETLKKLGIAPKNESYLVNTLRYLGLIDDEGNKTDLAGGVFSQHADEDFQKAFAPIVEKAYADLFSLHVDGAWDLDRGQLITFFRQTDQSSASVGGFQASTFTALAGIAGRGNAPEQRGGKEAKPRAGKPSAPRKPAAKPSRRVQPKESSVPATEVKTSKHDVGLTVRVEINLPAEGDQETYDRIFKSIRENLLDG